MLVKEYSVRKIVNLIIHKIYTILTCRSARVIRYPLVLSGGKYIKWGKRLTMGRGCRLDVIRRVGQAPPVLKFGYEVQLNDYVHICALDRVEIGDFTLIASHVYISDNSHGCYKGLSHDSSPMTKPLERPYPTSPVIIGEKVWIGEGVIVMPGVSSGNGCVIGAHSIVNTNVPDNCIAAGAPAKVIKRYNFESNKWERTNPDGTFFEK